jgi:hypothetical protein
MKPLRKIALIPLLALLYGCATVGIGQDPVVVNAERSTELAIDAFNLIKQADLDSYAAFKASNPEAAAAFRTWVNYLRANQYEWLRSARDMTQAYKQNRTSANKANVATAIAVLVRATATANQYLAKIKTVDPSAWILNESLIWAQVSVEQKR